MKKIILITILIVLTALTGIVLFHYLDLRTSTINTAELETITINDKTYKTTGAIPSEDLESVAELRRLIDQQRSKK